MPLTKTFKVEETRTFDVTMTHPDGTTRNYDINDTSNDIGSLLYVLRPGMSITIKRVGNSGEPKQPEDDPYTRVVQAELASEAL